MKWLLWKDYRYNRLIVFAALALLLGPYLVGLGVIIGGRWVQEGMKDGQVTYWTPPWKEIMAAAGLYSLAISQLSMALIGGNAISGERADRSAEFSHSLPITRRKLLASKLLLALAIAATVWLVNAAVLWCLIDDLIGEASVSQSRYQEVFMLARYIAITGLAFFCAAWILSSFVGSPAFDVCGGVVLPLIVWTGFWFLYYMFKWHSSEVVVGYWYCVTCLILAPACFAAGTWHYLRRVEP